MLATDYADVLARTLHGHFSLLGLRDIVDGNSWNKVSP